ncbi:hypothetical protein NLI96_g11493 [Meripilus lineatus]|uniref:Protein kinase domain-containing protein n=1 Tax=Meripilus lineatus TaxID=2056292 RepID=A0AAD5URN0_9APHY|nr:hypothetical protein NLI96_g11493 [Physisporinus lineatus]
MLDISNSSPKYRAKRFDLRRLLIKLSKTAEIIPSGLFLDHVLCDDRETLQIGGYADIFRGTVHGRAIALKRLRVSMVLQQNRKYIQEFSREALIWCYLQHPHILEFMGVDRATFKGFYCMVSPWMEFGSITCCMEKLDELGVQIPYARWLLEIALGLEYLHGERIVHGDLRGANILIDGQMRVRLADFGLALFADSTLTQSRAGGAIRWLCPHLLKGTVSRPEFASDVYSYGCVSTPGSALILNSPTSR